MLGAAGEDGEGQNKNFDVYLEVMGSQLFVSFRQLRQQKVFTLFLVGGSSLPLGQGTISDLSVTVFPAPMQWTINKYFE